MKKQKICLYFFIICLIALNLNSTVEVYAEDTSTVIADISEELNDYVKITLPVEEDLEVKDFIKYKNNYYVFLSSEYSNRSIVMKSKDLLEWEKEFEIVTSYDKKSFIYLYIYNNILYFYSNGSYYEKHFYMTSDGENWIQCNEADFPFVPKVRNGTYLKNGEIQHIAAFDGRYIISFNYDYIQWSDTITEETGYCEEETIDEYGALNYQYMPNHNIIVGYYNPNRMTIMISEKSNHKKFKQINTSGNGHSLRDVAEDNDYVYFVGGIGYYTNYPPINKPYIYKLDHSLNLIKDDSTINTITELAERSIMLYDVYVDSDYLIYSGGIASQNTIYNPQPKPVLFVKGMNFPSEITIDSPFSDIQIGDNTNLTINGTVTDPDSDIINVTAKINNTTKAITTSNGNFSLLVNSREIGEGTFNINLTIDDTKGGITKMQLPNTVNVKYILEPLFQKVETFLPDKSNLKRIIIADTDNRIIDDNVENRSFINKIKAILEEKNLDLYFIGGNNEITKDLAEHFE